MNSIIQICRNMIKKRFYLIIFVSIILIYAFISFFYFNFNNRIEVKPVNEEINDLNDRIDNLENVLSNVKENAANLKDLLDKSLKSTNKVPKQEADDKIGVLVMACNRPTVSFHLDQILKLREYNVNKFPIVVSQDCAHEETKQMILKYKNSLYEFIEQPDQSQPTDAKRINSNMFGYYKISRHYKFALDQMFMKFNFNSIIITEDDLNLSIDFFQYFEAMSKVLFADKTLFCVSAWNDNGKLDVIQKDPELIHRSDFFPGLGWMLTREFWLEIRDKWPKAFWDDWLRRPEIRKDRACIRPEVSRTAMSYNGKVGVSNGQFFDSYLKFIVLNDQFVDWSQKDLTYLTQYQYDQKFQDDVFSPKAVYIDFRSFLDRKSKPEAQEIYDSSRNLRIKYDSKSEFRQIAQHFSIMDDFKDGVPRTAYKGVVRIYQDNKNIYLVPSTPFEGYNPR